MMRPVANSRPTEYDFSSFISDLPETPTTCPGAVERNAIEPRRLRPSIVPREFNAAGSNRLDSIFAVDPRHPGSSQIAADGSFFIKGVFGRSRLRVALPDDWMVKTIMQDGRDITDTPIERMSGEIMSGVQIVVTNRVSTVAGQLTDDKGLPLTDATILVFADDPQQWAVDSRAVRAVRPDQRRQYQSRDYRRVRI